VQWTLGRKFPKSVATAPHHQRIKINQTGKYRKGRHPTFKKYVVNYTTFLQCCRSNAATSTSLSKLWASKMVVRILLVLRFFNFHQLLLNMAAIIQKNTTIPSSEWHSHGQSGSFEIRTHNPFPRRFMNMTRLISMTGHCNNKQSWSKTCRPTCFIPIISSFS